MDFKIPKQPMNSCLLSCNYDTEVITIPYLESKLAQNIRFYRE